MFTRLLQRFVDTWNRRVQVWQHFRFSRERFSDNQYAKLMKSFARMKRSAQHTSFRSWVTAVVSRKKARRRGGGVEVHLMSNDLF